MDLTYSLRIMRGGGRPMSAAAIIPSCPEVLVLRHGQTEWNAEGRLQGHLDSPLTEKGLRQAQRQNEILQPYGLTGFRFISSPQGRAHMTAQIALAGLAAEIETSTDLMEIGMGAWAGTTRAEIAAERKCSLHDLGQTQFYDWAPGGEGTARLYDRCAAFLAQLAGPAVLVTHGMTSLCLRLCALGWGLDRLEDLPSGQGVVYRVKVGHHDEL
ncbi:histidine phosphatase family protein [Planktomarina temperata]|nr:histidine phosphatase family protein [Planktomarina temperata]